MRRIALVALSVFAMCGYAQQIDTTTPYFEYEEEVIDTTKAVQMANQIRGEKRTELQDSINEVNRRIALIQSLKEGGKKKIQSSEEVQKLKAITIQFYKGKDGNTVEHIMQSLDKGKIHASLSNDFGSIMRHLSQEVEELEKKKRKYDELEYTEILSPLPTKIVKRRKDNPNYMDSDFHWLDKFNTSGLEHKTTTFPTQEDYYYSDIHPQFKFIKDRHKSHRWIVYDQSYNLLAVSLPTSDDFSYESFEDGILNALVKYDYEHNAYDINSESPAVKKYVAYTVNNGRSAKSKLASVELAQNLLDRMIAGFRNQRAAGRMTQEAFNKQLKDYNAETAKNKKLMEELRRQIPSKEVMERADNYIRQLRRDNEGFDTREFTVTRIDGLTVILQSPKGLKVRQRGYFDKKENAVEWQYEVIEKPSM